MQDLTRKHADSVAEVRRLSKLMRRMKRLARQQGGPMDIGEAQRRVARVLVCMSNGEPTAAVEYLCRSKKTRCWDVARKGQVETDLRLWWRGTDDGTRQTYLVMDDTNRMMHQAIIRARRFSVDGTLETWVDTQNVQKGINPAPSIVMQQAVAVKRRIGVEHTANHRSDRRWLQRWRRRRGVQLRRGIVREQLSVDKMHRKVSQGAAQKSSWGAGCFWVGGVRGGKKR